MTFEISRHSKPQFSSSNPTTFVPLTLREANTLNKALIPILTEHIQQVVAMEQKIAESGRKIADADRKIADAKCKIAEGDQKIAKGDQKIAIGDQMVANGDQLIVKGDQMIAEGDRKIVIADQMKEEGTQKKAEGARKKRETLVNVFYRIFYDKNQPAPTEEIDTLFTTYLAEGDISFDEGKRCFTIKKMKGIVRFLETHSSITRCNFIPFKAEICDMQTLATHLKQGSSKVVRIDFKSVISLESKLILTDAVKTIEEQKTRPSLEVIYKE